MDQSKMEEFAEGVHSCKREDDCRKYGNEGMYIMCVMICYAPTSDQVEDQVDFLKRLKISVEYHRKQEQLVIQGDFNAKVGKREAGDTEHIGNFGFRGMRSDGREGEQHIFPE